MPKNIRCQLLSSNAQSEQHDDLDLEAVEASLAVPVTGAGPFNEPALLARNVPRSDDLAAPNLAMHPLTGTFADHTHELAFTAQLFHLAFPGHCLLLALTLGVTVLIAFVASTPDLQVTWAGGALCSALGLAGRVLLHRYDSMRAQRVGSRAWTVLFLLGGVAHLGGYMVDTSAACASSQKVYLIPILEKQPV